MKVHTRFAWVIVVLVVVMTGCDQRPEDVRDEPATHPDVVAKAVEDLAGRLEIDAAEIEVRSFEAVTWPDSSLGCPENGMMYAQVLTEGSKIELAVGDRVYAYHAADGQQPFLCESDGGEGAGPR